MVGPTLALLLLFYGYPILDNLLISFTDLSLTGLKRGGSFVGLANYRELISQGDLGHLLFNTLVWLTATSVLIRLLLGLAIAVLLNSSALRRLRLATIARFALPIGLALARRGVFLMSLDANGPVPGLTGRFLADRMPKFAKGPIQPRLGDLAFTEIAMFGV